MDMADMVVEIERYMSQRGITHSDSIEALIEAIEEDIKKDER